MRILSAPSGALRKTIFSFYPNLSVEFCKWKDGGWGSIIFQTYKVWRYVSTERTFPLSLTAADAAQQPQEPRHHSVGIPNKQTLSLPYGPGDFWLILVWVLWYPIQANEIICSVSWWWRRHFWLGLRQSLDQTMVCRGCGLHSTQLTLTLDMISWLRLPVSNEHHFE